MSARGWECEVPPCTGQDFPSPEEAIEHRQDAHGWLDWVIEPSGDGPLVSGRTRGWKAA